MNSLSKFKTNGILKLNLFGTRLDLIHSNNKCDFPPNLQISSTHEKEYSVSLVLQILNGFQNAQNLSKLNIYICNADFKSQILLKELISKVSKFNNLFELRLPLENYDGFQTDIIKLLQSLKKLVYVYFQSKTITDAISLNELIQYAVHHKSELRLLYFNLCQPIKIADTQNINRVYPLEVILEVKQNGFTKEFYFFDTRYGVTSCLHS
ncbi:hypothetical protein FGO68_gene1344 [Halteria grandinella]|uniref:Uncharacterized protein n=1 Tax=Halteria grandinella TaxID=5974 RepID=A0A8J8T3U5_HALGN|nr:hypothetical protein FGO68_gene1344 [Halteria grandinella]